MAAQQRVSDPAESERDGDEAVGREEGRVDSGEISRLDDRVLLYERRARDEDAGREEKAAARELPGQAEEREHHGVEEGRDTERPPRPPAPRRSS